jgi:hypothetical protein
MSLKLWRVVNLVFIGFLVACSMVPQIDPTLTQRIPMATPEKDDSPLITGTASQSFAAVSTPQIQSDSVQIWLDPAVPNELVRLLPALPRSQRSSSPGQADLKLVPVPSTDAVTHWVYSIVAPFPTVTDEVRLVDIQAAWRGESSPTFSGARLLLSPETRLAFEALWGPASPNGVQEVAADKLLETAWAKKNAWALLPFEQIGPRWKVLRVEGMTPLDNHFDLSSYPLVVGFLLQGSQEVKNTLMEGPLRALLNLPVTNRDPAKLTVLVMTGTTSLIRAVGYKMETLGMTYPGRDIRDWLRDADLLHISNEVSFEPTCPHARLSQKNLMFCSRPEYIALLDDIDANIIELTGNHLEDWRRDSLLYTLALYQEHNMRYYGGGANLSEARQPLLVENNGNRLAFIGCNPAGPVYNWATETLPGAADCDYEWMKNEIGLLRDKGYLVIVTLQYNEHYAMVATPYQQRDFPPLASAGAVIVQGSQAHFPQTMQFVENSLIHYGLGNLFFDQMDIPIKGTRREFIDRHVFYDGRYLGVELLTAMLEDYARPRPMTPQERSALLQEAFEKGIWK